ncbi:hypothetical protein KY337_02340 [Candidatus Woesearchaeota archaeon]|nr:hypothetical protein [Candidatus Woesearchaeota archaeon]
MVDLEKIMSCSAGDYVRSKGKELSDYIVSGIHLRLSEDISTDQLCSAINTILPAKTEAVTDYRCSRVAEYGCMVHGTALVPKDQ